MWKFTDQRLFQEQDFYLVPICLLLLTIVGAVHRRKYIGTSQYRYFMPALYLRFLFCIIYALVIAFYYGYGDTSLYYQALTDLRNAVGVNTTNLLEMYGSLKLNPESELNVFFTYGSGLGTQYYMFHPSNYMVPRVAFPFSLLFNNSYLCICFCLSYFSFAGCWRIFRLFTELYPGLERKFAAAILFLPSVLFWGGSLLKDSITIGSLGFLLYGLYNLVLKRRRIAGSVLAIVLSAFLIYIIKPYIILCLVPTFLFWVFMVQRGRIRDRSTRVFIGAILGVVFLFAGALIFNNLGQTEIAAQYSSDRILETVKGVQGSFESETSGSNFQLQSTGEESVLSTILLFPMGLVATLFRPFLWEGNSPLMLMSALESFGFLVLTFLLFSRIKLAKIFQIIKADPVVIFCLVYSILFAGIIGATTTNFGALVRYKIPCVPFYLCGLFIIMHKSGSFDPRFVFGRKFF